jgi:hypothetical protein
MPVTLANHLRPRREKIFGDGPRVPLDREAKIRIMHLARALKHKTERGKHYGMLTGKFVDVLHAMLWLIHDGRTGQCNPAYATIAAKAGCAASTVCEAIKALELSGILSWANRITRRRERELDLFGHWTTRWRVVRTSNAYVFHDPRAVERQGQPSNTEIRGEPPNGYLKQESGARLAGARVIREPPRQPPGAAETQFALQREHAAGSGALLSAVERAVIEARQNAGTATAADWEAWRRDLDARLDQPALAIRHAGK